MVVSAVGAVFRDIKHKKTEREKKLDTAVYVRVFPFFPFFCFFFPTSKML